MKTKTLVVKAGRLKLGNNLPLILIAGPCVIESEGMTLDIARKLKEISHAYQIPLIFKASYDKANRSSEAPVPVVEVTEETQALGGAGNVASNLSSLGATVRIVSVIGNDTVGEQIKDSLRAKRIDIGGLIIDDSRPTSIKTRIIAQHQQVVRVDREVKGVFPRDIEQKLDEKISLLVPQSDAVIISDYGKGLIGANVLKKAIGLARKRKIPINVDPKIENFMRYRNITCITPNTAEAAAGMHYHGPLEDSNIAELGKKILKELHSDSVLITRGEKGMTLFESKNRITHIPTRAKEVFDVTGAGDTVIATFTLALAAHANLLQAAEISNFAAGVVVGKLGTATVSPEELQRAIKDFDNHA